MRLKVNSDAHALIYACSLNQRLAGFESTFGCRCCGEGVDLVEMRALDFIVYCQACRSLSPPEPMLFRNLDGRQVFEAARAAHEARNKPSMESSHKNVLELESDEFIKLVNRLDAGRLLALIYAELSMFHAVDEKLKWVPKSMSQLKEAFRYHCKEIHAFDQVSVTTAQENSGEGELRRSAYLEALWLGLLELGALDRASQWLTDKARA